MIYNWEFDDSVDFAPPHYRKSKYQKVEQLSKQIINEATALEYLEAFEYVEYLVCLLQKDAIKLWQLLIYGFEVKFINSKKGGY